MWATRRQGPHNFERRCILATASANDHTTVKKRDDGDKTSQILDLGRMMSATIHMKFEITALDRPVEQRSTADMISSVEIVTRMLIFKVDEAMASGRPSDQWDKVRMRLLFFSLYVSVGMARGRNEFVLHVNMDKLLVKKTHSDVTFVSNAWDTPKAASIHR